MFLKIVAFRPGVAFSHREFIKKNGALSLSRSHSDGTSKRRSNKINTRRKKTKKKNLGLWTHCSSCGGERGSGNIGRHFRIRKFAAVSCQLCRPVQTSTPPEKRQTVSEHTKEKVPFEYSIHLRRIIRRLFERVVQSL